MWMVDIERASEACLVLIFFRREQRADHRREGRDAIGVRRRAGRRDDGLTLPGDPSVVLQRMPSFVAFMCIMVVVRRWVWVYTQSIVLLYVRYNIIYFDLGCVGECVVTGLVCRACH